MLNLCLLQHQCGPCLICISINPPLVHTNTHTRTHTPRWNITSSWAQWMADHRRLTSKRDNYPQLKADRKNKRFISVAGLFLLLVAEGTEPLTSWRGGGVGLKMTRSLHNLAKDLTFKTTGEGSEHCETNHQVLPRHEVQLAAKYTALVLVPPLKLCVLGQWLHAGLKDAPGCLCCGRRRRAAEAKCAFKYSEASGLERLFSGCFSWQRETWARISPAHNPLCMQCCMTRFRVVTGRQLLSHSIKSRRVPMMERYWHREITVVFSPCSPWRANRTFPLRVCQSSASNRWHVAYKRHSFGNDDWRNAHVASSARPRLPLKTF